MTPKVQMNYIMNDIINQGLFYTMKCHFVIARWVVSIHENHGNEVMSFYSKSLLMFGEF